MFITTWWVIPIKTSIHTSPMWVFLHTHTRHVYWKYPVKLSIFTLNVTMILFFSATYLTWPACCVTSCGYKLVIAWCCYPKGLLITVCCHLFWNESCFLASISTYKILGIHFQKQIQSMFVLKFWIYYILAVGILIIYLQRTKYWLYPCCRGGVGFGLFLLMTRQVINKLS